MNKDEIEEGKAGCHKGKIAAPKRRKGKKQMKNKYVYLVVADFLTDEERKEIL